jgi:hypothetical protein
MHGRKKKDKRPKTKDQRRKAEKNPLLGVHVPRQREVRGGFLKTKATIAIINLSYILTNFN